MKWDKPNGSVQQTSCGRYVIVQANSQDWVAYQMGYTCANDLGTRKSYEEARQCCEDHESQLVASHRRSA